MSKILFLSDDIVGGTVAGPGMRYIELAKALSHNHDVCLVSSTELGDLPTLNLPVFATYNLGIKLLLPNPAIKKRLKDFDIFITNSWSFLAFNYPKIKGKIILDLYCPWFFEQLASGNCGNLKHSLSALKKIMQKVDFMICANEHQKDLYLAWLLEGKMLNPGNYKKDPSIKNLVGLVPTGLSSLPPIKIKKALKGVVPGIAPDDKVIIWWGGIWEWLDAETAIKAMAQAIKVNNRLRLVFFGIKHPNLPLSQNAQKALALAKTLDLLGKSVFFLEQWVPYQERADWLLESDLGLITHFDTLETRFSWRTRVLDYFWADLPVISTEGDSMAELIAKNNLGRVIPFSSPDKLSEAIVNLLANQAEYQTIKANIRRFKPPLYWENVIAPIERYLERSK